MLTAIISIKIRMLWLKQMQSSTAPIENGPEKNYPACKSIHSYKTKSGETAYSTRMHKGKISFRSMQEFIQKLLKRENIYVCKHLCLERVGCLQEDTMT